MYQHYNRQNFNSDDNLTIMIAKFRYMAIMIIKLSSLLKFCLIFAS